MLTACFRRALQQSLRNLHSSSAASSFRISCHGLDKLWQTSDSPRSTTEEAAGPKGQALAHATSSYLPPLIRAMPKYSWCIDTSGNINPSIRMDFDVSDCTNYLKRSMHLRHANDSKCFGHRKQHSSPPHERPAGKSDRPGECL